jgi:hypothetical protein
MVLVAWLSAVASAEAQSTGGSVEEGPASIVVLDVGGYVASGPFSSGNAAHGLVPFRLGAVIDVLTLDPRLSFAVTGSAGGLVEAWLREPGAFTDATYSDELFAANGATGVRLRWRVSPEVTARFGADAVWPLRDVHDGGLGAVETADTASASAQSIDPWDPFLYQGDYVQLVPRAEIELRIDGFFGGIEGAFAFGFPTSSRVGWTTLCPEVGLYVGARPIRELALGMRAHVAALDDGPRVVTVAGTRAVGDAATIAFAGLAPFVRVEHRIWLVELLAFINLDNVLSTRFLHDPIGWSVHTRVGVRFDTRPTTPRPDQG